MSVRSPSRMSLADVSPVRAREVRDDVALVRAARRLSRAEAV